MNRLWFHLGWTVAMILLQSGSSLAFLGQFGVAINNRNGDAIIETDPDQVFLCSLLFLQLQNALKYML